MIRGLVSSGRRWCAPILVAAFVAVLLAAPVASIASAAPASPAASATPTPSVDEIVDRYVAACGGLKKIKAIQSLREKGRVTTGANREALVTRERKRPGRARFEFTVQGVTSVYASDGQRGWRMSPFDGDTDPNPLPDEVVMEASEQGDLEGPLVDWKAKGHQVELVGRETLDGRETWKLKITLKSGAVRHEYFDVKSYHRVRINSTRQVRGRPVQIETTFSDYRKTGGILFPRLIEVAAVGRPQRMRVVVDSVEVNPVLDDARFEMPASARP